MSTARRWKRQDAARRGPALSDGGRARLVVSAAEVGCGARRPPSSSPFWPRHARCPFLRFCKVRLRWYGSAGGVPSSFAARARVFSLSC